MEIFTASGFSALIQVILVDLVLAGDNAIVVGMAAAALPPEQRRKVILWGIAAAAIMRIIFAVGAVQLLQVPGLLLVGGVLLLWVCWRLWSELRGGPDVHQEAGAEQGDKTMRQAIVQIVVADLSMSIDNVLAVAGIARDHMTVMVIGLVFAVAFMVFAASMIADLLNKHRWIGYVGLITILYVSFKMIWDGSIQLMELFSA